MNFDSGFYKILETLLGSIGVIIAFLFGIFLLLKKNKHSKANLFLAIYLLTYSLRVGKSLFHSYYRINTTFLTLCLGVLFLIGPSLWFYSRHLATREYSIKRKQILLHYLPFFCVICLSPIIPNNGEPNSRYFYFGLALHALIYAFYTLYWLLKNNKESITKTKNWLLFLTFATILMFTNFLLIFFGIIPYHPRSSFLFTILILSFSIWAINNLWLFIGENEKYSKSGLSNQKAETYISNLDSLMEKEKLYLNPELNLQKLSLQLDISSKLLSQAINQVKKENYSQYITKYRIKEAKRLLALPKFKEYTIAAIAFDSGFNSISSFNSAFKKIERLTAIEYRQSI
ncbi:MAG: helix-turn-helix domain-containing protein [Cellulophaga sp.]